jgi:hypothetical protein
MSRSVDGGSKLSAFETSVSSYQTTRLSIPEDSHIHTSRRNRTRLILSKTSGLLSAHEVAVHFCDRVNRHSCRTWGHASPYLNSDIEYRWVSAGLQTVHTSIVTKNVRKWCFSRYYNRYGLVFQVLLYLETRELIFCDSLYIYLYLRNNV